MNKRGIFPIFFAIGVTIALLAIFLIISGHSEVISKQIGNYQENLLLNYEVIDSLDFYVEKSLQTSLAGVLPEYLNNGFYSNCGMYGPFYAWRTKDKECYPDKYTITKSLREKIINPFNFRLEKYQPVLNSANSADFLVSGDKFVYSPLRRFKISFGASELSHDLTNSVDLSFGYDYSILDEINTKCSGSQDLIGENKLELKLCVEDLLVEFSERSGNGWNLCNGLGDLEKVQREQFCGNSLEYNCYCNINNEWYFAGEPRLLGSGEDLGFEIHDGLIIPLEKKSYESSFPICRSRSRSYPICVKNNGLTTRFAYYVDDEVAPSAVDVIKGSEFYSWKASSEGDVKWYLIFEAQEGLSFDYSRVAIKIRQATNANQVLKYITDTSKFRIDVIPVDYSGNCLINGELSDCSKFLK